jgi:ferredoxin
MKVTIDREACIMCGSCENICDKVFHLPQNEKSTIVERFRTVGKSEEGQIPADLESCAKEAADACPASAITVE